MLENEIFEFYRGRTYQKDFTISEWSLPISKVYFTVKENAEFKKPILQKTLGNGITLVSDENGEKTFNLLIDAADTDHMKTETDYIFEIAIHSEYEDGYVVKENAIAGILRLKANVTKPINE